MPSCVKRSPKRKNIATVGGVYYNLRLLGGTEYTCVAPSVKPEAQPVRFRIAAKPCDGSAAALHGAKRTVSEVERPNRNAKDGELCKQHNPRAQGPALDKKIKRRQKSDK